MCIVTYNSSLCFPFQSGFSDLSPVLMISEASLKRLNSHLDTHLPMQRFRPNIVISNCQPHQEVCVTSVVTHNIGNPITTKQLHQGQLLFQRKKKSHPGQKELSLEHLHSYLLSCVPGQLSWQELKYILGMRTCIFCLAPASQCVNTPTEAARARALLTAREARLPTNLRTRRKLRMTEVDIPKRD